MLLGFLLGRRRAIEQVARNRSVLWAGLLLVLAAGLAREYDVHDLARQPWHLLLPPAVSMAIAMVLYLIVRQALHGHQGRLGFLAGYGSMLGLVWMTAPLALLYGIPYERLLGSAEAVAANLWTLAAVSAWRVLLMARVVSVLTGCGITNSFLRVMLLAGPLAGVVLLVMPAPALQLMGGVRLSPGDDILAGTKFLATPLGVLAGGIFLIAGVVALVVGRRADPRPLDYRARGNTRGLGMAIALCLAVLCLALPMTQREQRLRSLAEQVVATGSIPTSMAFLSSHQPGDFPPHWEPPPRLGWTWDNSNERPAVLDVAEYLADHQAAPWVRAVYLDKLERRYLYRYAHIIEGEAWPRLKRLLDRLPEGPDIAARNQLSFDEYQGSAEPETPPATTQSTPPRHHP